MDADRFSLNTTTCDTLTSLHAASHSLLNAGYVDGRQMALLREQISRCHATLSRSKDYLSVFADRLNDLIEQMNATSTAMREKLKSENWPIPEVGKCCTNETTRVENRLVSSQVKIVRVMVRVRNGYLFFLRSLYFMKKYTSTCL